MANEISSRFGAVAFCEFLLFYVFFLFVCFIKKSAFVTRKNNRSFSTRDRHFLFKEGWRVGVRPDEIRANWVKSLSQEPPDTLHLGSAWCKVLSDLRAHKACLHRGFSASQGLSF